MVIGWWWLIGYTKDEIINEDVDIYVIDPKQVEFLDLKDNRKVIYIDNTEDIQEKLLSKIDNKRSAKAKLTWSVLDVK